MAENGKGGPRFSSLVANSTQEFNRSRAEATGQPQRRQRAAGKHNGICPLGVSESVCAQVWGDPLPQRPQPLQSTDGNNFLACQQGNNEAICSLNAYMYTAHRAWFTHRLAGLWSIIRKDKVGKMDIWSAKKRRKAWDFPDSPVVKTAFQCRGCGFNSWSKN